METETNRRSISEFISPYLPERLRTDLPVVPVVRMSGVIGFSTPLRPGLSLALVARSLETAFKTKRARAVALAINSPGGSAVQSHLIFRRIRDLATEHKLPVLSFVEDVAASGGYMIACAGDEIFCDPSSIVGSIGVIGATFGLDKAIGRLGIERRVYTSGEKKVTLDPFLPENPDDVARLKAIQHDIHEGFIALVKERRGASLRGQESALFSGEYWVGTKAQELGLVDGLRDLRGVLRERFGEKVRMPLIVEKGWFGRRVPGVGQRWMQGQSEFVAGGFADEMLSAIEARAIWARYGL
ncbi:MAG TPA: S49 family peptidase [Pseudorhodoplanes sp.]|nr:S49 family peptidase [Pseudorhodoplanes sp.]